MTNPYHTAAYIRLSREDGEKDESDSVINQRHLLLRYIGQQDDLLLYDVYVDDGYSGVTFHRPAFRRMLRDIEKKRVNCVIVKDLSRFGRDYIETGRYLERYFPEAGIRFISVNDHIDSMKQSCGMLLPIKNIFNEQYARDISEKVRSAIRTKQKDGEFIGAFASYGYRKSPSGKNTLVIDPCAARIVRRIFALYLNGWGKKQIADLLNKEGVPSPSEYKRAQGLSYENPGRNDQAILWSYSTINHILHKEIYAGNMVQGIKRQRLRGKQQIQPPSQWIVVPGTHEPVIDRETWARTQELLKNGGSCRSGHTLAARPAAAEDLPARHPFAGLLRCGSCGRAMVKTSWCHADGSIEHAFCCGNFKRHGKTACTSHRISARFLHAVIWSDLQHILSQMDLTPLFDLPDHSASQKDTLRQLQRTLCRLRTRGQRAYEDYQSGLLRRGEYLSYREELRKQEDLCIRQEKSLKQQLQDGNAAALRSPWMQSLLRGRLPEDLDNTDLLSLIHRITVFEHHEIHIAYRFLPVYPDAFPEKYPSNLPKSQGS